MRRDYWKEIICSTGTAENTPIIVCVFYVKKKEIKQGEGWSRKEKRKWVKAINLVSKKK